MKHLILLGGGHAHVHVLRALAANPLPETRVMLVSPYARQMYSGMVPGLIAGHYRADQCVIPLKPLALAGKVSFVEASATAIDTGKRSVTLSDGRSAGYDVLSIDTGPVMDRIRLAGAREHALAVRPIERFVSLFGEVVALAQSRVVDIVVIGAGAAGVELALAMQHRFSRGGIERARVSLVTGGDAPLSGYSDAVRRRAATQLARQRVTVFQAACLGLTRDQVLLPGGMCVASDVAVLATGTVAPLWLRDSGLALDANGFIATGETLQSVSHPEVFAVGDVASRVDAPHPKSGVYAVRSGPPLAENLRKFFLGQSLQSHHPQLRTLNLISLGRRSALASWGPFTLQGRLMWWWKDAIDRGFIARYTDTID